MIRCNHRKGDPFEKVVRGWAIRDRRTFSGEILGENEKAENVKVVLSDNGMVQLYIDNKCLMKDLSPLSDSIDTEKQMCRLSEWRLGYARDYTHRYMWLVGGSA